MEKVCRATYSVDGEEYEGTVVNKNVGNKSVTVRFHGYNNEEEVTKRVQRHVHDIHKKSWRNSYDHNFNSMFQVRLSDLMESLGPEAVDDQVSVPNQQLEIKEK